MGKRRLSQSHPDRKVYLMFIIVAIIGSAVVVAAMLVFGACKGAASDPWK